MPNSAEHPWQIIDNEGVIEEGNQEEINDIWITMLNNTYDWSKTIPGPTGDVKLIQVHGVI